MPLRFMLETKSECPGRGALERALSSQGSTGTILSESLSSVPSTHTGRSQLPGTLTHGGITYLWVPVMTCKDSPTHMCIIKNKSLKVYKCEIVNLKFVVMVKFFKMPGHEIICLEFYFEISNGF